MKASLLARIDNFIRRCVAHSAPRTFSETLASKSCASASRCRSGRGGSHREASEYPCRRIRFGRPAFIKTEDSRSLFSLPRFANQCGESVFGSGKNHLPAHKQIRFVGKISRINGKSECAGRAPPSTSAIGYAATVKSPRLCCLRWFSSCQIRFKYFDDNYNRHKGYDRIGYRRCNPNAARTATQRQQHGGGDV